MGRGLHEEYWYQTLRSYPVVVSSFGKTAGFFAVYIDDRDQLLVIMFRERASVHNCRWAYAGNYQDRWYI